MDGGAETGDEEDMTGDPDETSCGRRHRL